VIRIEPMSASHVEPVARLHVARLTGLVTRLGLPATRAYYAGAVRSPNRIALVALDAIPCGGSSSGRSSRPS
jgi:hypothetical protein